LFLKRQSCRANYRKRLKDERTAETLSYTNELHEALLTKNCKTFWKCWNCKLEKYTKCTQVEGCVDAEVTADQFTQFHLGLRACNDLARAEAIMLLQCQHID